MIPKNIWLKCIILPWNIFNGNKKKTERATKKEGNEYKETRVVPLFFLLLSVPRDRPRIADALQQEIKHLELWNAIFSKKKKQKKV